MSNLYGSEQEIRRYYPISIRFHIGHGPGKNWFKSDYLKLYDKIDPDHLKAIEPLESALKDYGGRSGIFLGLPVQDKAGRDIGVRYVLFEHETGPEILLPLNEILQLLQQINLESVKHIGDWVASGIVGWLITVAFDNAIKISKKLKRLEFDYVEICTPKGDGLIPFQDILAEEGSLLLSNGLRCLFAEWESIQQLDELNQKCFKGLLIEQKKKGMD